MQFVGWLLLITGIIALAALAWWWRRASRRRCPIDGSIRCRHCQREVDHERQP